MTHHSAAASFSPFTPATPDHFAAPPAGAQTNHAPMRQLYLALSEPLPAEHPAIGSAAEWLAAQLHSDSNASGSGSALPASDFAAWQQARQDDIDEQYKQYMAERRAGAPRRMFGGRAHALHYLSAVAPARLTDGAWLYGVLARWDDPALQPLIATYLEELGNGVPDKNHVVIFQQLIDAHGCAKWRQLGEAHFHGGLTQLALAHHAERFLPELVGYNLGAEHASLDTLIAAYEMNELGIDPYYFTLHATVDNGLTGHARLALQALEQLTPQDDPADFLRRVEAGYRLHQRALSSAELLAGFDLERELVAALAGKHIPARRPDGAVNPAWAAPIAGRPLGEWLADPGQVPALLAALESHGWVARGGDPAISRLWGMIEPAEAGSETENEDDSEDGAAPLAQLFSAYELALLADWIATDPRAPSPAAGPGTLRPSPRAAGALALANTQPAPRRIEESAERGIIRHRFPDDEHGWEAIANELSLLEARVVASSSKAEAIALLTSLMAPSNHHTSTGLMATRMFSKLFTA
jgi:hypothetical protein